MQRSRKPCVPASGAPRPCPSPGEGPIVLQLGFSNRRLGLQDLAAPIHAALEVDVMRAAQLARILVLDIGWRLERIGGAAHAAARGRSLASGNGHRVNSDRKRAREGAPEMKARLIHANAAERQSLRR